MKILQNILYYTMFVLSGLIAMYAFVFFAIMDEGNHLFKKFLQYPIFTYMHIFGSGLALLCGPIQFSQRFRNRFLSLHKKIGLLYLFSVLVGGIGGFYMALHSDGGLVNHFGFGILAILWLFSTLKAFLEIKQKNIRQHQNWMIRSFAFTFAAVTLRFYMPLLIAGFKILEDDAYQVISWLCWVPNLVIAEWFLVSRTPAKK